MLSIVCIAIPIVYAVAPPSITVDIEIHVPKGFLKPGIQVFFNRQNGGQVNTDGWKNMVSVSEFGLYSIYCWYLHL